jgi:hypothetical protein
MVVIAGDVMTIRIFAVKTCYEQGCKRNQYTSALKKENSMRISKLLIWIISSALVVSTQAGISFCTFNFGLPFRTNPPSQVSYLTSWAGSGENYNMSYMMQACKPGGTLSGVTPVVYSYIIAFTLRRDHNLQDCNVGTPNLCQQGAAYMRTDRLRIMGQVAKYAKGTAADLGTTTPIVWLMEPDYYQYAEPGSQGGNPLSYAEAAAFMNEMLDTIQKYLPKALFSLDISPWTTDMGTTKAYYTAFTLSRFSFINTSGGGARAGGPAGTARITGNKMTYKEIHDLTGKPMLADCGYGVAGASTGYDPSWDSAANLNNRIADGVIGICQNSVPATWNTTLTALKPLLNPLPSCTQNEVLFIPHVQHLIVAGTKRLIYYNLLGRRAGRTIGQGILLDAGEPASRLILR